MTSGMATRLAPERYLESLRASSARMTELVVGAAARPVPECPGWTVRDAVVHTGSVFSHKVAVLRAGERPAPGSWDTGPADEATPEDVAGWFTDRHRELEEALRSRRPEERVWSWFPPEQTVAFWYRRMAQEAAVHRVDVESGAGVRRPVDPDVAVDGIDEVLRVFLDDDWSPDDVPALGRSADGSVTVAAADGPAWPVLLSPGSVAVTGAERASDAGTDDGSRADSGAGATVSGSPSDVLLWLWGRVGDDAVRVAGDPSSVRALRAWMFAATQ